VKEIHVRLAWIYPVERPKEWKRDMRFGAWNVWSLYRSGALTAGARELARYRLDRVGKGI